MDHNLFSINVWPFGLIGMAHNVLDTVGFPPTSCFSASAYTYSLAAVNAATGSLLQGSGLS